MDRVRETKFQSVNIQIESIGGWTSKLDEK